MVEISPGELLDKISILEIKLAQIENPAKLKNVRRELDLLNHICQANLLGSEQLDSMMEDLRRVNRLLWVIEDDVRECERNGDFGPRFIDLARSVYRRNDERSAAKRRINDLLGSDIIEEKSYEEY